jgi:CHAT domain-containing protein
MAVQLTNGREDVATVRQADNKSIPWSCIVDTTADTRAVLLVFANALLISASAAAQSEQSEVTIVPGQAVSRAHGADEPISYLFDAKQGQSYLVEITQSGLDIIVTLDRPDADSRIFDSPLLRNESEFVFLEGITGNHRITLHSDEATHATGSHTIRVDVFDTSQPETEAWRLMSSAAAANAEGSKAGREEAWEFYRAASELWRSLGRQREFAYAQFCAGMISYWDLWDWKGAATFAEAASAAYLDLEERSLYANAIFLRGYALVELASEQDPGEARTTFERAFADYSSARDIHEQLGNTYDLANVINYQGVAAFNRGDFDQAKQYWRDAAPLFEGAREWGEEFKVLQNLAVIDVDKGFSAAAIRTYQDIVDRFPEDKDPAFLGTVLDNLGAAERDFGNIDDALKSYSAALEIQRRVNDRRGVGYSLKGLGVTYYVSGELDLAKQYLRQALPIAEEVGDGRSQASILTNLGDIAYLQERYEDALSLHEKAISRTKSAISLADRHYRAAKDLVALGRYDDAIARANTGLELAEEAGAPITRADSLQVLGRASIGLGRTPQAASFLERSRVVYRSLGRQGGEAEALNGLALAAHSEHDLQAAIGYGEASIDLLESLRNRVTAPELRAFYSATRRRYYELQIELLMEQFSVSAGTDQASLMAALTMNERSRARMMMDLLSEASINLEQTLDPALAKQRNALTEQLAAYAHQVSRLSERGFSDESAEDAVNGLLNKMAAIETELNLLETQLRRDNAAYAAFASPGSLTAADIQTHIDASTVLLQYSLGRERSYVWVVTPETIRAVELADRKTIEDAARTAFNELQAMEFGADARRRLDDSLMALSEFALLPVVDDIGDKRILLVLDGALQYVPFGVLPLASDDTVRPLAQTNEIVGVPSVSVIAAQRARAFRMRARKELAIFADPVFESDDPRLSRAVNSAPGDERTRVTLATRSSVDAKLDRLAYSGQEARAIADLVAETEHVIVTGLDANRQTLLDMDLQQFRILHFATHGLVDSRYPALTALAFSQYDDAGQPQNGLLRLHDIYNLDLNADLVVLSACETALGREIRGEGLIGLTQGFMYAGARSLVVSLWQVEDRATAELMTRFYRNVFDEGLRPAEALAQAQLSIANERRWADPYFWAAFTVLGDWEFAESNGRVASRDTNQVPQQNE